MFERISFYLASRPRRRGRNSHFVFISLFYRSFGLVMQMRAFFQLFTISFVWLGLALCRERDACAIWRALRIEYCILLCAYDLRTVECTLIRTSSLCVSYTILSAAIYK